MRFFLVFLLFTSCSLFAQKEGNIWYFGENAGIDFNSGTPVALTNGQIDTKEGCAAISNASGYLLFYTDGMKVYNRAHNQMPNGDNLDGNSSATSSGVIVPRPGSTNLFYILTIDAAENDLANGLRYSIVDLNSDGGMGDVTTKNILLSDNMTEKITAVAHCNGTDIWVITHKFGSSTFYIYKITTSGLMTSPTTQTIGLVHEDDDANHFNALGQIKSSIDGTRIAVAIQGHDGLHYVQLFDFDNNTGILSNTITLNFEEDVYGIEFSPDNRYLYADHRYEGELYQFDLSSNNQTTIQNSRVLLGTITDDYTIDSYNAGALQLAPDGKIYVARHMSKYLGVIANPNGAGSACNFSETGFYLGGKKSKEGLPTFIQSYFYKPELNYGDTCLGHATWFQFNNDNPKIDSIRWNFGDPASGAQNTSNSYQTSHIFTSTGTYTVRLYYYICNSVITITKNIKIIDVPVINLGPDTLGCTGITIDLSSPYTGCSYNWSNGSHALSIHVNGPGTYWLQATNSCGSDVDTVIITFADPPTIYLPGDTEICETEAYILDAGSGFYSYQWSTGSTSQTIQPTATGTFEVTVTDNNFCKGSASTFVDINMQPYLELGDDLEICENTSHTFHPYTNCHHYLWHDGSTNPTFIASDLITATLTVTNACGSVTDDVSITALIDAPELDLGPDSMLCGKERMIIDAGNPDCSFYWSTGSRQQTIEVGYGEQTYWVTAEKNGCPVTDSIHILACTIYAIGVPNAFTPNGDGQNDILYVYGNNIVELEFLVFNRFGQLLFTSNSLKHGWDGIFNGKMCEMDVYVWVLHVNLSTGVNETHKGNVSLIR